MDVLIQIGGSALILIPFVLAQVGRLRMTDRSYLALNLIGSTIPAINAAFGHQWGFLLLEGVWGAVSLVALFRPKKAGKLASPEH